MTARGRGSLNLDTQVHIWPRMSASLWVSLLERDRRIVLRKTPPGGVMPSSSDDLRSEHGFSLALRGVLYRGCSLQSFCGEGLGYLSSSSLLPHVRCVISTPPLPLCPPPLWWFPLCGAAVGRRRRYSRVKRGQGGSCAFVDTSCTNQGARRSVNAGKQKKLMWIRLCGPREELVCGFQSAQK